MLACAGKALLPRGQAPVLRHPLQQPHRVRTARTTATSKPASDCQSLLAAFYECKELWKDVSVLTISFECDNTLEVPKNLLALASPVLQDVMAKDPDMKSYKVHGSKETWAPILVRYYPIYPTKTPPLTPKQVLNVFPVAQHYGMSELLDECKAATEKFTYTTTHPTSADQADVLAFLEAAERLQEPGLGERAFKRSPNSSSRTSRNRAELFVRLDDPKGVQLGHYGKAVLKALLTWDH